jgi:DNA-directed RNA polymerase specialized sigma24 family protein
VPEKNEDLSETQIGNGASEVSKRIANLLALHLVTGKPQPEQISLLSAAGYSPSEIARLVGTTRNTVSVTLSQRRKGKRKSKKKKH